MCTLFTIQILTSKKRLFDLENFKRQFLMMNTTIMSKLVFPPKFQWRLLCKLASVTNSHHLCMTYRTRFIARKRFIKIERALEIMMGIVGIERFSSKFS